jgi:hypothetical protein
VGQAQPARDAGGQVLVGRRVEREPPPGFAIRVPADEPDAGRHLAAEDEIAPGVAFTKHDYLPMLSGSPRRLREAAIDITKGRHRADADDVESREV